MHHQMHKLIAVVIHSQTLDTVISTVSDTFAEQFSRRKVNQAIVIMYHIQQQVTVGFVEGLMGTQAP